MVKARLSGRGRIDISARTVAILNGEEDLSMWSDEELIRGQRKDKNGRWLGRPPVVVPQAVHAERVRRTMTKAHQLLRESTYAAVALLRTVVDDEEASYSVRLQAASLILERTLPKNENYNLKIGIDEEPLFMRIIRDSVVSIVPGELGTGDDSDILDAEVIGEDEITWER